MIVETWHATVSKGTDGMIRMMIWEDHPEDNAEVDSEWESIMKFLSMFGLVADVEKEL